MTYYVRKWGNDGNGGTNSDTDALLTIAAAEALAGQNDTIDLGEGTWEEDVNQGYQYVGAGKYKTFIVGKISRRGSHNMRILLQDLTFYLNDNIPSRLECLSYNGWGFELNNVRFLGNGFGSLGASAYVYGAIKIVDSIFDNVDSNSTSILLPLNYVDANAPSLYIENSVITGRPGQYYMIYFLGNSGTIKNSTFYATVGRKINTNGHPLTHYNNFFYNVSYKSISMDSTEQTFNPPVFRDVEGGDFRFLSNAPQIGGGI